jgi:hypothetical protein
MKQPFLQIPLALSDPSPDRPSQFCHILSIDSGVKRHFFPKNPAVFRRNTVIFPEKRAIRGLIGLIRDVLVKEGVPWYGGVFSEVKYRRADVNPGRETDIPFQACVPNQREKINTLLRANRYQSKELVNGLH